ncbi:uncharacterized protein LOC142943448 [Anarhichas minor]|uniref:uncharacterized protein LOC142943448 n=1 Tax=Anarhichas minor TaxID=65739 RepID=UPI003F732555
MSLTVRSSGRRRRRKDPDEKLPESTSSSAAQVMAPTRMKLRVRRRDNAAAAAGGDQPEEEEEGEGRSRESGGRRRRKTTASTTSTTAAAAAAASWSPPPPPSSSASARVVMAAEEASPDSKCPICLDRFNNLAYLDRCLHRFCFPCIQEWSHNKAECPLCKQPFASILHSVRAEDDFKEYTLRPPPANSSVAATVAMVAAMASAARSDHQMRLMLRRHRGGEATTRRRRRGERGGGRRSGVWEWYLDSPPLTLPPLPHPAVSPVMPEYSEQGEELGEQRTRGGADMAERGVIFEGLTGLGGGAAPAAPNDRASRRLMTRLVARQRLQREGGTVRRLRERETVAFRRALYRNGIRVRGVSGNQQQRDITAESFRRNPTHLNRLRPWLRRELTVLYGAHGSLVDIVQRIIMARVARHGLEDTPTIEEELRQFLLARTDHFLHELVSFARSPLGLETYDLHAAYEPPDAAMELDGTSSPSDGSSVIAISEGEEEERPAGGRSEEERLLEMADGTHDDVIQSGSCLSLAVWDDETPGPSYSTAEPSCSLSSPPFGHAPREAANGEGGEKEEEECLIVGYKKPIAERTPELVQLSSDTEEEEEKKKKEDTTEELAPLLPSTPSYLPTIPPSTSGAYGDERGEETKEKDGEPRARSWSGSSRGSRNSVCALSPAAPGDGKSGSEAAREKKKKKKKMRKSGTLYNPNRSIYPAMMRHRSRSSSPFRSSVGSGSPDSTWEYHCSQVSPLTSVSSPSRCSSSPSSSSSSPFCTSSPPPPMPSLSPGDHVEKPGGKRKYKSRHLDSDDKDPTWRPSSREKEGGRRKGRRERQRSGGERRSRADRSPSVEIIYEGTVSPNASQPPAHKRCRRRQRKTQQHSSSSVIITLDSDSSLDDADEDDSSSPISSQQTVDFSDLPPLPSVRSDGVGGALGAEIGELPVDILDRGSEGSEAAAGPIAVDNSDDSVDVENVEESGLLLGSEDEDDEGPMGATSDNQRGSNTVCKRHLALSSSDSCLLASILDDLRGIGPPAKGKPPVNFDDDVAEAHSNRGIWLAEARPLPDVVDQNRGFELPACRSSIRPPPPPLERLKEVKDVPPLLKQASPVRSYNRNTPPPLKHKDAGSPHLSPVSPVNLLSPRAAYDPLSVNSHVDLNSNPVDSRAEDDPPVSTLKRHLANDVQSSCHLAPVDPHSTAPSEAEAVGIDSTSHKPPADTRCSFSGSENRFTSADRFLHLLLNSSSKSHSVDLHPVNSLPAIDFHSAKTGWSNEKPAHTASTSRGCREKTDWTDSCLVAPVDHHPSSGVSAEGSRAAGAVFSGVDRYDTSPPAFVSSLDFRNRNHPSSPIDSHSFSKREGLLRFSGSSVPTAAPRLSPIDVHPSPKSTVDLHSSSAAPEGLTDKASSLVNYVERSPYTRLPPIDLHSTSPVPSASLHSSSSISTTIDNHLNHTALSSATVDSHSKLHLTDSRLKPRNHFDPRSDPQFPIDDRSKHRFPVEPRPPVDSHPNNSQRDNHTTSSPESEENQWNSSSSVDQRSDSRSPVDQRSADSVWNTHTHSAT